MVALAVGETVIPLPLVGVSIGMWRGRQQNDRSLAGGYQVARRGVDQRGDLRLDPCGPHLRGMLPPELKVRLHQLIRNNYNHVGWYVESESRVAQAEVFSSLLSVLHDAGLYRTLEDCTCHRPAARHVEMPVHPWLVPQAAFNLHHGVGLDFGLPTGCTGIFSPRISSSLLSHLSSSLFYPLLVCFLPLGPAC